MIKIVNFSDFCDSFGESHKDNFSYEGKRALFDYLEEYEDSTGETVELDTVALCCDFAEYASATEAASNYFDFEGMNFNEDGDEMETADEVEKKAMDFLLERTSVITIADTERVIIANF